MATALISHSVAPAGVARQPILTAQHQVYGYELLCRSEGGSAWTGPLDHASARVLDDAVLSIGLAALTSGRRAFVNLSRETLLSGAARVLPTDGIVLELLENIPADAAAIDAVESLRARGYVLALDDFVPGSEAEAFLPFATFVKVDVLAIPAAERASLAARLLPRGLQLIAEKVETREAFAKAQDMGYSLFQGYYFCRPSTVAVRAMATNPVAAMRLIAALNQANVHLHTIEDLLKQDPRLSYRVLRSVNSAAFGLRRDVHSIGDAVLLLGLDLIRKWASIWALAGMNGGSPELVNMTIVRARACELLGRSMGRPDEGAEFFLLGLCSLLDAILGRPMASAIDDLPLSAETRGALLGEPTLARHVLGAVTCYERGAWDESSRHTAAAGLDDRAVHAAYQDALNWGHQISHDAEAALASRQFPGAKQ